jgi:pimeloyl-ACP methyl ester carboxylesterase
MSIQTGYAPVRGLRMYYEIHGPAKQTRPPLVLLHGGGDTI